MLDKGQEKADGNGNVVTVTPDAKLLEVVMARLKMLGVGDPARNGTAAGDLAKRAERVAQRLKLVHGDKGPPPMQDKDGTEIEPA